VNRSIVVGALLMLVLLLVLLWAGDPKPGDGPRVSEDTRESIDVPAGAAGSPADRPPARSLLEKVSAYPPLEDVTMDAFGAFLNSRGFEFAGVIAQEGDVRRVSYTNRNPFRGDTRVAVIHSGDDVLQVYIESAYALTPAHPFPPYTFSRSAVVGETVFILGFLSPQLKSEIGGVSEPRSQVPSPFYSYTKPGLGTDEATNVVHTAPEWWWSNVIDPFKFATEESVRQLKLDELVLTIIFQPRAISKDCDGLIILMENF